MAGFIKSLKLDARPDRLDLRDRRFAPLVYSLPPRYPSDEDVRRLLPDYARHKLILDQESEGACTGFGLACVINYLFWRLHLEAGGKSKDFEKVSERMLYHLARFYDEWPGEDYEGSSCRGALKAWHKHGVCGETLWPYRNRRGRAAFVEPSRGWDTDAVSRPLGVYYRVDKDSVVDMQAAIRQVGAIYVSAEVHDGWDVSAKRGAVVDHERLPVIGPAPDDGDVGNHAFAVVGYNEKGFVVQNSWGTGWGARGFAVLPYEDWVRNGADAWVFALGVPVQKGRSAAHFVRGPQSAGPAGGGRVSGAGKAITHQYRHPEVAAWDTAAAYDHTVVMGNDGRVINRIVSHKDAADNVRKLVFDAPLAWLKRGGKPKRLAVYAHGGLNSEAESLHRIRILAPYFKANGIYPLFLTWKTGPLETIKQIVEDEVRKLPQPEAGIGDVLKRVRESAREIADRTIEVLCEAAVVKPMWSQMKQNARAAARPESGTHMVAEQLAALAQKVDGLEIHFVGHSAGSIILGHMLEVLAGKGARLGSCSLYAPACSVGFALEHYAAAVDSGALDQDRLDIHLLSDERERDDSVGPYGKSLLYLVSRALEDCHKMPLLGLAEAFDPASNASGMWNASRIADVEAWQKFWKKGGRVHVLDEAQVSTGVRNIDAAHGCFDNDVATVATTLEAITGGALRFPVEFLDY